MKHDDERWQCATSSRLSSSPFGHACPRDCCPIPITRGRKLNWQRATISLTPSMEQRAQVVSGHKIASAINMVCALNLKIFIRDADLCSGDAIPPFWLLVDDWSDHHDRTIGSRSPPLSICSSPILQPKPSKSRTTNEAALWTTAGLHSYWTSVSFRDLGGDRLYGEPLHPRCGGGRICLRSGMEVQQNSAQSPAARRLLPVVSPHSQAGAAANTNIRVR